MSREHKAADNGGDDNITPQAYSIKVPRLTVLAALSFIKSPQWKAACQVTHDGETKTGNTESSMLPLETKANEDIPSDVSDSDSSIEVDPITKILNELTDENGAPLSSNQACEQNNKDMMGYYLSMEEYADETIKNGENLIAAARFGRVGIVEFLLDGGADIAARDNAALKYAAWSGHAKTVSLLLDRGADIATGDNAPLRCAAQNGHAETVTLLLDRGADIAGGDNAPLRWAAQNGHTETVTLLLDRGGLILLGAIMLR
ncbi:MAG: ankyrin repeat domain-containing protein [Coxiellaceae bacterium]|nr:ankyrin repeat domain-containing protein [Coxiellaceae bacterium]